MKSPNLYKPTTRRRSGRVVRELQPDDLKAFRLTPALERAGYRVPPEVLLREGFAYKRIRQAIEERNEPVPLAG